MMLKQLLALTLAAVPVFADPTALDIVKKSLDREHRNWQRAKDYTYRQREVFHELDAQGNAKSTSGHTYDVLMIYGRPYRRLVEKDGKPLDASGEAKQEDRLRKEMEKRRKESEELNSKERRDYEKQEADRRKFIGEIPEAFNFTLRGVETIGGKPAWMIEAEPKAGYQASDSRARMFAKMRGTLWIDQAEYQWVKVQAAVTDTISFGWFLARVSPGTTMRFEQRRVNEEVWLPAHLEIGMDGRLGLVKKLRAGLEITYADYKKFQTDSRILTTGSEATPEAIPAAPAK